MKSLAQSARFQALVVPVRPTKKSLGSNVWVCMESYVRCRQGKDPTDACTKTNNDNNNNNNTNPDPYDPWLRKHVQIGARIVKVCHQSTIIEHSIDEWQAWTGIDFSLPSINPYSSTKPTAHTLALVVLMKAKSAMT